MNKHDQDFESYSEVDTDALSPDERSGLILLPAYAVFTDLSEMGQLEDFDPRYSITFRLPKGNDFAQKFFAVCALIAAKTWKTETDEKLAAIWDCITHGVKPKNSNISLQDGDSFKPEYNRNHWLVKASRREDEGRPTLYDRKGNAIYGPAEEVEDEDGVEFIEEGELIGDEKEVVKGGDYCMVLVRVWAQKNQDRLNFSVIGVRLVKRGSGLGKAATAQQSEALKALASGDTLPSLPVMPSADEKPKRRISSGRKKAAGKSKPSKKSAKAKAKKAPKKAPKKKKSSVFRKGRRK